MSSKILSKLSLGATKVKSSRAYPHNSRWHFSLKQCFEMTATLVRFFKYDIYGAPLHVSQLLAVRIPGGTGHHQHHQVTLLANHFKVIVESLQSHCIHTQSHWSSGSTLCFLSWGTWVQSPGGYLCETGNLLLALSCYIGDPDVIDHCGLVLGGLRPEPSLGCCDDNVIIPPDPTQLFCPGFMLAAGPPSSFTTDMVGCWVGSPVESLQSHCIHTQCHWSSG